MCARHRVLHIVGKHHLSIRDYKRREGLHWNERGHRRVAAVLKALYKSFLTGGLPQPSSSQAVGRSEMSSLHESHAGSR
jgi:hypothetical protein